MSTKAAIVVVIVACLAVTAIVGPRGGGGSRPRAPAEGEGAADPVPADVMVSRWRTATGRLVESAEPRRGADSVQSWLARAGDRCARQAADLAPVPEGPGAADSVEPDAPRPRLRIEWSDPRGIHHTIWLHQPAWASAELWALDSWLVTSFVERHFVADAQTTPQPPRVRDG